MNLDESSDKGVDEGGAVLTTPRPQFASKPPATQQKPKTRPQKLVVLHVHATDEKLIYNKKISRLLISQL